jgi:hypothetical protein
VTSAELAQLVVDLTRQLAATRQEVDAFRLVTQQALHALHTQYGELARTRQRYHALLDEMRATRKEAA